MNLISSWFYGSKTSESPLPISEHPLTKFIKERVNLELTPEPLLWTLKHNLRLVGVNEDCPVYQEIDKKLNHHALPALGYPHKQLPKAITMATPSERCYVQPPNISIVETKKVLEEHVGKLDAIELCLVDDDLMAFIAQQFPQLKSLQLVKRVGIGMWDSFTDSGLESIAQLKELETLTLDVWYSMLLISYTGLTQLINQPHFVSQLQKFKISNPLLTDEALKALAKYKQLNTLYIQGAWIKEQGLMALCQSTTLKKSMIDFTFLNSTCGAITDNTLTQLKGFGSLEHFTAGERGVMGDYSWKISENTLLAFLEAQKKLKTLNLLGPMITDLIAEKIGQMNQLENLQLSDCSQLSSRDGWKLLLNNKENLTYLDIKNATLLGEDHIPLIGKLSLTFLSIDKSSCISSKCIQELCKSPSLQKQLKTLHLSRMKYLKAEGYTYLQTLQNLTSLRLDKCHWFNEDALKVLSESSLAKTLNTLELVGTGIDDKAVVLLAQFSQLKYLLLGDCYALTKIGCEELLDCSTLRENLIIFGTEHFDWTEKQLEKLAYFDALKVVILSNDESLSFDNSGPISKIAEEKGFSLSISFGITGYLSIFEEAIAALN
jgi:hypothetical protein